MANTEGVLPLIRVAKTPHKDVIIRASSANSLRGNPLVVHAAPHATARAGNVQFCLVKSMWTGPEGARREAYLPKMELRSWTFSWESFTAAFIAPKARSPRLSTLSWIFSAESELSSFGFSLNLMAETLGRS